MFSSSFGRWLSPDPLHGSVSNPQSLNRYAYAGNNPATLTDPSGLFPYAPLPSILDSGGGGGGAIFGNDIFDAVAGTPGTYLTQDMYGNVGFGFSDQLWSVTQAMLDGASQMTLTLANPAGGASPSLSWQFSPTGFQVLQRDYGTYTETSGVIPELLAAAQGLAALVAAYPGALELYKSATIAANLFGMSPTSACAATANPGVCDEMVQQINSLNTAAGQLAALLGGSGTPGVKGLPYPPILHMPPGAPAPPIPPLPPPPPPAPH